MKLYWRVKRNGKWTWRSAGKVLECHEDEDDITIILEGKLPEEE